MAEGLPVGSFSLMTPAPGVVPSGTLSSLSDFGDKPTVVHLYTG
jgi:hypothetical protein